MLLSAKNQALCPDELCCDSNQLGLVIEYIKNHPNVRVNILLIQKDLNDKLEQQLSILGKVTTNYTVACSTFVELRKLLSKSIPAYLNFPITDWETFSALIDLGVSDILIDGPLGFQMDTINSKKENTLIRVRPNESPNAAICLEDNENTFFIRPEDLEVYNPFIDICEIFSDNKEKEMVLYNIYKRKSFNGDLSILVPQLKISIQNPLITKNFAKSRLNCGQKCKSGKTNCQRCSKILHFTNLVNSYFKQIQENNIEIK